MIRPKVICADCKRRMQPEEEGTWNYFRKVKPGIGEVIGTGKVVCPKCYKKIPEIIEANK